MHRFKTALPVWLVLAGIWIRPGIVRGQSSALLEGAIVSPIPPVPSGAPLVQRARCDICPPVHEKYEAEFDSLHMNWVLVDDTKGNHRAQMRWVVDR
jgi:hypothetical protein